MSLEEAEALKAKANEFLKLSKLDEAIKEYNKAISIADQVDSEEARGKKSIYLSNRSAAWAGKGRYESALSDAEKALAIDSKFVKGYGRKGLALFKMGRVDEALQAYRAGLVLDPSSSVLQQSVQSIIASQRAQAGSGFLPGMGSLLSFPKFLKGSAVEAYLARLAENKVAQKIIFYALAIGLWYGGSSLFSLFAGAKKEGGKAGGDVEFDKVVSSTGVEEANWRLSKPTHTAFTLPGKGGIHYLKRTKGEKQGMKTEEEMNSEAQESTIPEDSQATDPDNEFESSVSKSNQTTQDKNLKSSKFNSLLFLHAPAFSAEGSRPSFDSFPEFNLLALDLPCHGRSTCWQNVTSEDYETTFTKLIEKEGSELLLEPRMLFLSGYSPWLTKPILEVLKVEKVVWTRPMFHILKEVLTGENLEVPKNLGELRRVLGSSGESMGLKQLRDIVDHFSLDHVPKEMRKMDAEVTRDVLEAVLEDVEVLAFVNEEDEVIKKSGPKKITEVRMEEENFTKEDWVEKVKKFMEGSGDTKEEM